MSRYLCVDIGAGTMDVLWFDTDSVHHNKAVVVSPVRTIAERAARMPGDLVVTGCEMGGGPVTSVLRQRAETHDVVVSLSAAATLHHDVEKVRAWGLTVVDIPEADRLRRRGRHAHLELQDVEADRLERLSKGSACPSNSMRWLSACRTTASHRRGCRIWISGIGSTGIGSPPGPIPMSCCSQPARFQPF